MSITEQKVMITEQKVMIAGDTHGNMMHCMDLITEAHGFDADLIIVVGDFGYWEHEEAGGLFLDVLSDGLSNAGIEMWFLDGNHDNHPLLWEKYGKRFTRLRPHLWYCPRGFATTIGTTPVGFMGGAYSIDAQWRRDRMAKGKPDMWWETEMITDEEVEEAIRSFTILPPKVLFAHDAPEGAPMHELGTVKLDVMREALARQNREQLSRVVEAAQPDIIFHGHYHKALEYKVTLKSGKIVPCVSIGPDTDSMRMRGEYLRDPSGKLKAGRGVQVYADSRVLLTID